MIDQARAKNGRVFMHCQVGTSRSASLAIAYVMYRCGLSLLDAYLLVRARRLLLVIQPNLLFVYNLLEYERQLYGRISLPWLDLARGIALLNSSC
jgi:dual specificity MAP kinase phosphatase